MLLSFLKFPQQGNQQTEEDHGGVFQDNGPGFLKMATSWKTNEEEQCPRWERTGATRQAMWEVTLSLGFTRKLWRPFWGQLGNCECGLHFR